MALGNYESSQDFKILDGIIQLTDITKDQSLVNDPAPIPTSDRCYFFAQKHLGSSWFWIKLSDGRELPYVDINTLSVNYGNGSSGEFLPISPDIGDRHLDTSGPVPILKEWEGSVWLNANPNPPPAHSTFFDESTNTLFIYAGDPAAWTSLATSQNLPTSVKTIVPFSNQSEINIVHNKNEYVMIKIYDEGGDEIMGEVNQTLNDFTVSFGSGSNPIALSGTIIYI